MSGALPKVVRDLLHDAARVRNVPGIAQRRAAFLHDPHVVLAIRTWRIQAEAYLSPTTVDMRLLLHDLVAVADAKSLMEAPEIQQVDVLATFADTFVALAASGDQEMTRTLFQCGIPTTHVDVDVDVVAKMAEAACVAGQAKYVTWLARYLPCVVQRHTLPWQEMRSGFDDGLERGLARLYQRAATAGRESCNASVMVGRTVSKPLGTETTVSFITGETLISVLTCKSLMIRIGSYHEHPREFLNKYAAKYTGDRGACVRIHYAIIHNDLLALRTMYSAYRLDDPATTNQTTDFRLAMHVAACEGRLEILQWLHERSLHHHNPLEIHCRPDTMAMSVRCGWADVVEWLHFNRPESVVSMSELAINDAAQCGHADVLRACHKYKLGPTTETALVRAAIAGRLQVVQLIHSLMGDSLSTARAMDSAIEHGHAQVTQFLRDACGEVMDERRFTLALCSDTRSVETMNRWLWSTVDVQANVAAQRAAQATFVFACEKRSEHVVALLLPLVQGQTTVAMEGLERAVAAHHCAVVKLVLPLFRDDSVFVLKLLTLALRCGDACIAAILAEIGRLSPEDWAWIFRWTVANPQHCAVDVVYGVATTKSTPTASSYPLCLLADLSTSMHRRDALSLLAHVIEVHDAKSPPLTRTESTPAATMIRAIKAATKLQVVEFLLQNDPAFYTEDIVLTHAPACIQPKIVRFLLNRHSRQTDPDASVGADVDVSTNSVTIARLVDQPSGFLTLHELEMVESVHDSELNARVASHHKELLAPTALDDAARAGKYHLLVFVHTVLKLPQLTVAGLVAATICGGGDTVSMFLKLLETDTVPTIATLMCENQRKALHVLVDKANDKIDEAFLGALSLTLAPSTQSSAESHQDETSDQPASVTVLQWLVQQRPTLHAKLLQVAASAGSETAMAWLWSPESGVDTATIQMLPVAMAAARGGHRQLLKSGIVKRRLESEVVDVAHIRQQYPQVSDAGGLQLLLSLLEQWNPRVRLQLEEERTAARALFGVGPVSAGSCRRTTRSVRSGRSSGTSTKKRGRRKRSGGHRKIVVHR